MRVYDLIAKKRDGGTHSREELEQIVNGYVSGEVKMCIRDSIVAFSQVLHTRFVGIHNCHIMVFLTELPRQRGTNLADVYKRQGYNRPRWSGSLW